MVGEKAAEKGAMTADKGEMGVEATNEEKRAMTVQKAEMGVKAANEEKGATTAEKEATAQDKGEDDSIDVYEDEGETEKGNGNKREIAAFEKGSMVDWDLEWQWKGATIEDAAVEEDKEKEDTAAVTEGAGEKMVFFFDNGAEGNMITLMSSEGHLFRMSKAAARMSMVLADLIDNDYTSVNIPLPNIDDRALATVIKYCDKHTAAKTDSTHVAVDESVGGSSNNANTTASKKALDEWDCKLVDDLTQDAVFDLITAADFLGIKGLLDAGCQKVADIITNKTPAQVRTIFGIANDFTVEEEEEFRNKFPWAFDEEEDYDDEAEEAFCNESSWVIIEEEAFDDKEV